ncbi:TOG array regulator of axonemal microtubules 1-like isoform X1, partial [Paramuricea clavata]
GLGDPPSDVSSARVRKAPVTSGVGSRSSSILSTDGAGTSSAVSNVASPVSSTSRESSRRRTRRVSHDATSPQDQEDVSNLVEQLSSKDWQERMHAIDTMAEMIETRLPLFTSNIVKIMDGFSPRLIDNNSKVNLHALQCLHRVIPTLREPLKGCITSILPTVAKNLASKNSNIGNMAENVLDSFIKHLDNARLLQPLCQFILLAPGGVQNRPSAVKKLL